MLFSSSLAYLPAFAGATEAYVIEEGEGIEATILSDHDGRVLLVEGYSEAIYWQEASQVWVFEEAKGWSLMSKDLAMAESFSRKAVTIAGTAGLLEGDYKLISARVFEETLTGDVSVDLRVNAKAPAKVAAAPLANLPPQAMDIYKATPMDVAIDVAVLDHVTDPEGMDVHLLGYNDLLPTEGSLSMADDKITYTPAAAFTGAVTFAYTVEDAGGLTGQANITLYVVDGPLENELVNDNAETPEITPIILDVLANDLIHTGMASLRIVSTSTGAGHATLMPDQKIKYFPSNSFHGQATIVYEVMDQLGMTKQGMAYVEVRDILYPYLMAVDDTIYVNQWVLGVRPHGYLNVISNDIIVDTDARVTNLRGATYGEVTLHNDDHVVYHPNYLFSGVDYLQYDLVDNKGNKSTATIRVVVLSTNILNSENYWLNRTLYMREGDTLNRKIFRPYVPGLGQVQEVVITVAPKYGQATIGINGQMTYTAHDTYTGADYLVYMVKYPLATTVKYVKIYTGVDHQGRLGNDVAMVDEDSKMNHIDIMSNDDIDEGVEHVGLYSYSNTPQAYSAEISRHGDNYRLIYSPAKDFNGIERLSYYLVDKDGYYHEAYVDITVLPVLDEYDIPTSPKTVLRGDKLIFNPILENNLDFGQVTDVLFSPVAFGHVSGGSDGVITYTPDDNHAGLLTLNYTYTNVFGDIARGQVVINVLMNNNNVLIDIGQHEEYFIQQYSQEGIDLLDGITWLSNDDVDVTLKWIDTTRAHGLIADDFSSGKIMPGDPVDSYGLIYLTYFAKDKNQNVGQSLGFRKLRINYQPVLSLNPISLDINHKPVASMQTTALGPDHELFFGMDNLEEHLLGKLFLFDHEDYPVEGMAAPFIIDTPVMTMPPKVNIKFMVGNAPLSDPINQGHLLTDENLWQQLILPKGQEEAVFDVRFFALDSMGGVSDLTNVYSIKVKNHPPVFREDGQDVPSGHLYLPSLYTETAQVIDLWQDVQWYDFEAAWFSPDLTWAVEHWLTYAQVDERTLYRGALKDNRLEAFDFSPGFYELNYNIMDANGAVEVSRRYIEVNTPPAIVGDFSPLVLQKDQGSYDLWQGMAYEDDDSPKDPLTANTLVTAYYDFDQEKWLETSMAFTTGQRGFFKVTYSVMDQPWSRIDPSLAGDQRAMDSQERLVWVNQGPDLILEENLVVILENQDFDPMAFVSVKDQEDDHLNLDMTISYTSELMVTASVGDDAFNTSKPGIYTITYGVTDSMGITTTKDIKLYIVEPTTLNLYPKDVEMDLGGYFPTYYGVDATFWNENVNITPVPEEGAIKRTLIAMIDDEILNDRVRFNTYDSHDITYTATLWVFKDNAWQNISQASQVRTLKIMEEDLDNYIYTTDFGERIYNTRGINYDSVPGSGPVPVLVKFNPDAKDEEAIRFVSALMIEGGDIRDIAVTKDGKVYLLVDNAIFYYDSASGDLGEIYSFDTYVQSLTADEEGRLLVVSAGMTPSESGVDMKMFEMIFVNPNTTGPDHAGLETMKKTFMAPYTAITDIVYSDDFMTLYGVGYMGEGSALTVELFELLPYEGEVTDGMDYMLGETLGLDPMFKHDGIATLGKEIFVTRTYIGPMMASETGQEMMTVGDTYVDKYMKADGFVFKSTTKVDKFFTMYTGAGSAFESLFELAPINRNIGVGYNKSQADGRASFSVTLFPEVAFQAVTWKIISGETYINNLENGTFEAIADKIGGSASAVIEASTVLKATGELMTRQATINITRAYPPTPGPLPEPAPEPTPAPAPVVGVTLDTDAITLDYGDNADPEFLSYDFTETVTGTANTGVTWSLDDETFVSVDENGRVVANGNVPTGTGDITVELTVRTLVGGASASATIIFEEKGPLGAIEFFEPYVTGYPDGSFAPDKFVSRAEVATMFARFLNLNMNFPGTQKFEDVSDDHWAYTYVQSMYRTGIFTGYEEKNGKKYFEPDAPIKRSEIAEVITNYWNYLEITVSDDITKNIPDVTSDYWAFSAINRIFNTGIFMGFEDGSYRPEDPTLRKHLVAMINALLDRPKLDAGNGSFEDVLSNHPYFGDIEAASQTFLKPQGE